MTHGLSWNNVFILSIFIVNENFVKMSEKA